MNQFENPDLLKAPSLFQVLPKRNFRNLKERLLKILKYEFEKKNANVGGRARLFHLYFNNKGP